MSHRLATAFAGLAGDRRGTIEPGEAGLGEPSDIADLEDDLRGGARAMPTSSVESVDPVWATSAASSAAALLSCSRTSRSIATRCSMSRSRNDTVGSLTPEVSSRPSEFLTPVDAGGSPGRTRPIPRAATPSDEHFRNDRGGGPLGLAPTLEQCSRSGAGGSRGRSRPSGAGR